MSTLYRRGDIWWYKDRLPGRRDLLCVSLKLQERRLAKLRQQQLDKILTELRLPQTTWSFIDDLRQDPHLKGVVEDACEKLGVVLTLNTCVTIEAALKEYEPYSLAKKTTRTHKTDWTRITRFLKWSGVRYLHEIRSTHLEDYLIHLVRADGVVKNTANHTLQAIKAFLNFCVRREWLRENPAAKVEPFKIPRIPQHYLRHQEDIICLLQAAKERDPELFPMVAAAVYTGCRLGELLGLEWQDIDFAFRKITIQDKPHLGLRTKSGKFRVIPLHPDLAEILKPYRKETGFVFLPGRETRKYTSPLYRRWQEVRKASGMPQTTWYSLRRTFCSQLAMSGVSLLKIQVWAGHSDPRITKDHYAHLAPEYDAEIERVLQGGYNPGDNLEAAENEKSRNVLQRHGLTHESEWRGRRGSNPQPTARQAATLTN